MEMLDFKNHFPVHISNKNFNHFPNMENFFNVFVDHEKEALKRTILQQDAIFRKQVTELHRLYRKQRDLIEELKNGVQGPVVKGPVDFRGMKAQRRMLDLELPAEVYVDFEDVGDPNVETCVDPRERKSASGSERCLGLSLSTSQSFPCLGDLNEPLGEEAFEEAAFSSGKLPFWENNYQELREKDRSVFAGHPFLQDNFGKSISHGNSLILGVGPPEPVDSLGSLLFREHPLTMRGVDFSKSTSLPASPTRCHEVNAVLPFNGSTLPSFRIEGIDRSNEEKKSIMVNGNGSRELTFAQSNLGLNPVVEGTSRGLPPSDLKLNGAKFQHEEGEISSGEEIIDANSPSPSKLGKIDLNSPVSATKFVLEVNLEANGREEEVESASQVLSGKENENQGESLGNDAEAAAAAEKLLEISQIPNPLRSSPSPPDALRWFADVVAREESEHVVMDCFERAALDLKETKFKENSSSRTTETGKSVEEGLAKLLRMSRSRNGRRWQRDFQAEILPSLASLSRQEVAEDLQQIEWPAARRRHRHKRGGAAVEGEEDAVGEGRSAVPGWGRTTKRCRRMRCPKTRESPPQT